MFRCACGFWKGCLLERCACGSIYFLEVALVHLRGGVHMGSCASGACVRWEVCM